MVNAQMLCPNCGEQRLVRRRTDGRLPPLLPHAVVWVEWTDYYECQWCGEEWKRQNVGELENLP